MSPNARDTGEVSLAFDPPVAKKFSPLLFPKKAGKTADFFERNRVAIALLGALLTPCSRPCAAPVPEQL